MEKNKTINGRVKMGNRSKQKRNEKNTSIYQVDKLKERVKELDCLYGLTDIVKNTNLSIDEALNNILKLIPPAWQYSDITCVKITIDDKEYKTNNYKVTKWSQVSNIILDDKKIGLLEICYLEKRKKINRCDL